MALTEEQKRQMEQKRLEALAKRNSRNIPPASVTQPSRFTAGVLNSSSQSSSSASSALTTKQSGLTEQQKRSLEEKRKAAKQLQVNRSQQATSSGAPLINNFYSKSVRTLKGSCSLISPVRFEIEVGYHKQLIDSMRSLPSGQYNATKKTWSFLVIEHDSVMRSLQSLKPEVDISPLPNWILKTFMKPRDLTPEQVDIGAIDPHLYQNLMPFQKEGIQYGVSRQGRVLIADDMGLGKTVQALGLASYYDHHWPVLIICQSTLKYNWFSSVLRWLPKSVTEQDVSVISSGRDYIGSDKFIIISYDLVSKKARELQQKNFQFVIVDESHCIKDSKSARTKAVEPLLKASKCLVLLSGTPALSRPIELYTQIAALDPKLFRFVSEFGNRYCDGKMKWVGADKEIPDFSGSSHMLELSLLLQERCLIRRLKSEVLQQLPSKLRSTVTLDPAGVDSKTNTMKERKAENDKAQFKGRERHNFILEWYGETAKAKVRAVKNYIKELLSGGDQKFLVFAHHQIMMKALVEVVEEAKVKFIFIDGSVASEERNLQVEKFQTCPHVRVAILSITAANAGITLTAASLVVFAELFWNPGVLTQAEDRAHRIGQTDSVSIQYLVARDTADDVLWPMIQKKLDVLNKAGLSKDNFEESESKVLKDTRQKKIEDCFNVEKSLKHEIDPDVEALWDDEDFNENFFDDSPAKKPKIFMDDLQINSPRKKLERLFFQCTNPCNDKEDVNLIKAFCDCVSQSPDGPIMAVRLLAHKIQSPHEQEAVISLAVLEACVKSCGTDFHSEVGKFRFLNEMVKLVSPKYSGTTTSDLVKQKIIELLYLWTIQIPHEKKIVEAYEMLKTQGLVLSDPDYVKSSVFPVSATPRKVDMDDADSQKLQKLLHSKDPADIEAANKIIKGMVRKDEEKMEMISKRASLFESVNTNMKLLTDMMNNYTESDPAETRELISDLAEACEKLRPNLYRIAAQLDDDDEAIGEVLLLSDELNKVIDRYRSFSAGKLPVTGNSRHAGAAPSADLLGIDQDVQTPELLSNTEQPSNVLDDLDKGDVFDNEKDIADLLSKNVALSPPNDLLDPLSNEIIPPSPDKARPLVTGGREASSGLDSLDLLGESLLSESLPGQSSAQSKRNAKLPMMELMRLKSEPEVGAVVRDRTSELLISPPAPTQAISNKPSPSQVSNSESSQDKLVDIPKIDPVSNPTACSKDLDLSCVRLEMSEILPDPALPPISLQPAEAGVAVTAHFTKNRRAEGLAVIVVTLANHQQTEMSDILFKPVVSKGYKVKVLPASATTLAPLASVFSPPATATVITVIACTSSTADPPDCSLSFFLSFNTESDTVSHIGEHRLLPHTLWASETA